MLLRIRGAVFFFVKVFDHQGGKGGANPCEDKGGDAKDLEIDIRQPTGTECGGKKDISAKSKAFGDEDTKDHQKIGASFHFFHVLA